MDLLKDTRLYIPVIIVLATGMRRGELLGLKWKDFSPDKGAITINQTLLYTTQGLQFTEPRANQIRRTVTLPGLIVNELINHKKQQAKTKLYAGTYHDHDLICCLKDGTPWHPTTFSSCFNNTLKKHKLPHIRFYDLRAAHANANMPVMRE